MAAFRHTPDGVLLVLEPLEAHVLRQVTNEVGSVLKASAGSDDPVEARMFPRAYEDPVEEADYRDMVGDDLRRAKLEALEAVGSAVASDEATEVELSGSDVEMWLACLTDVRLALGTRLGVGEEQMSTEVGPDDPDAHALTVLHWLGWVQEGLLRALDD